MPSESARQANLIGADVGRCKRGEATVTGMSCNKLREWAHSDKGRFKNRRVSARRTSKR